MGRAFARKDFSWDILRTEEPLPRARREKHDISGSKPVPGCSYKRRHATDMALPRDSDVVAVPVVTASVVGEAATATPAGQALRRSSVAPHDEATVFVVRALLEAGTRVSSRSSSSFKHSYEKGGSCTSGRPPSPMYGMTPNPPASFIRPASRRLEFRALSTFASLGHS